MIKPMTIFDALASVPLVEDATNIGGVDHENEPQNPWAIPFSEGVWEFDIDGRKALYVVCGDFYRKFAAMNIETGDIHAVRTMPRGKWRYVRALKDGERFEDDGDYAKWRATLSASELIAEDFAFMVGSGAVVTGDPGRGYVDMRVSASSFVGRLVRRTMRLHVPEPPAGKE